MRDFLETTFGPGDIATIDAALSSWLGSVGLPRNCPEAEIVAAAAINLFREGYNTRPALCEALTRHKGLRGLIPREAS